MKSPILSLLFICFLLTGCNGQVSKNIQNVEPTKFAEYIASIPNAQIIDVRTPEEYYGQHIDNATNINWNGDDFTAQVSKLNKTKPVFVYCMSGGRSKKASEKLEELGFKIIYELQGGIMKWNATGLSIPSDKIIGMCSQEYNELLNSDKKILIDFYAEWCEPCKKMSPYLLQMQKDWTDKVVIIRLNADENKTLISGMKIDELPTLLLYENKEVKWKHSGFISEEDLKKQLQ